MPEQAALLGRRIVIYGATGSGKSTLARSLGAALGLGVVELDALRHGRGWDSMPFDEMRETVATTLDGYTQGWVVEGNYSPIREVTLSRCDTVIWLHLPWRTSFWRVFKRTMHRAWTGEPLWGSVRESWRTTFVSRHSILLWSITHHRQSVANTRAGIATLREGVRVYELRTPEEVEALVSGAVKGTSGAAVTR